MPLEAPLDQLLEQHYSGTYRAGIIGHTGRGNYGHGLDVAFVGLPGVEIVAVADPDEQGRHRVQAVTRAPAPMPTTARCWSASARTSWQLPRAGWISGRR